MITKAPSESHPRSFNPLGLLISHEQIPLRTLTNPYFTLRLAPNPLFRVSSHYPLPHPPTNSFWYRIGTDSSYLLSGLSDKIGSLGTIQVTTEQKKLS
jgi:hypothetical protein